jgi:hypothetical protein
MKLGRNATAVGLVVRAFCCSPSAQPQSAPSSAVVPQRVNFSGQAVDAQGHECRATHAAGVRPGRHRIGRSASPGRIAEK